VSVTDSVITQAEATIEVTVVGVAEGDGRVIAALVEAETCPKPLDVNAPEVESFGDKVVRDGPLQETFSLLKGDEGVRLVCVYAGGFHLSTAEVLAAPIREQQVLVRGFTPAP